MISVASDTQGDRTTGRKEAMRIRCGCGGGGGGRDGLLEAVMPELPFEVLIEDGFITAGEAWKRGERNGGNSMCEGGREGISPAWHLEEESTSVLLVPRAPVGRGQGETGAQAAPVSTSMHQKWV